MVFLRDRQRAGPAVHRVEAADGGDDLQDLQVLVVRAQAVDVGVGDPVRLERQLAGEGKGRALGRR